MEKPEERNIRINKVLRELNISLKRAVDYLKDKGIIIEASPNYKITQSEYEVLLYGLSPKPKEILALQKFYKINLELGNEIKEIIKYNKNTYYLNDKQEIVGLNLSRNKITDIKPLKGLTALTSLDLENNQITDIKPLEELTTLTELFLSYNKITDIKPLEELTALTELFLSYNQITDIKPLEGLTALTDLFLSYNQITDIKPLEGLTALKDLFLSYNKITDIKPLEGLTALTELDLTGNIINNIKPLKGLTALTTLYLSFNPFIDIKPLERLMELKQLNLSNNQITDIKLLEGLTALKKLNLSYNRIADIKPLEGLTALMELRLFENQITDIKPLERLTALTSLGLSNNQITDIKPLEGLTALKHLYLSNNQITDINQFEYIKSNKNLDIRIIGNPFQKNSNYSFNENGNNYDAIINALLKVKELKYEIVESHALPAKVLLLGNTQSGKSTMMDYLLQKKDEHRKINKIKDSTHILSIVTKPIELKQKELPEVVFFDFGGQDYYHGLYRAFLNNGALSILFWNAVNDKNQIRKDERNEIFTRDFNRNYWLHQLKYNEESKEKEVEEKSNTILIVQTHADNEKEKRTTFNGDCENMHIENEFFVALNQKAVDDNPKYKISLDYFEAVLNEQIKLKQETKTETKWYSQFLDYIQQAKGASATSLEEIGKHYDREQDQEKTLLPEVLRVLATTGLILYYKDDPDLTDIAWLDPTATIADIHKNILKNKELIKDKGRIEKAKFEKNDAKIIKLLCNQKVVFLDPNPKDHKYIVPGYLPLTSDDNMIYDLMTFDFVEPNFVLKFKHFIPFGLINQLICYYGNNPEKKHCWRDQLLFTKNNFKVLIKLDFNNLEILVSIKSNNIKESLNAIEKEIFEDIMIFYWGVEYAQEVIMHSDFARETAVELMGEKYSYILADELNSSKRGQIYSKSPNDLYLSVDNKTFVHHKTLQDEEKTHGKITAFNVDTKNENEVVLRTINETKTREQLSGLYKNFTTNKNIKGMKKIFISYSRADVDYKNELKKYLNFLGTFKIADAWSCDEITIGLWDEQIQKELQEADLIIFMLSIDFFGSNYILENEVATGINLIKNDTDKQILCVKVSDFPSLDIIKKATANNDRSTLQETIMSLSDYQYLPYGNIKNAVTGENHEKITSLKEHSKAKTIDVALTAITNKVLEFCNK